MWHDFLKFKYASMILRLVSRPWVEALSKLFLLLLASIAIMFIRKVDSIRSGTRGTTVDNGSNRNIQPAFGDVLVDGVVGKARETVGGFVDVDFRFVRTSGFGETQNRFDDSAQFALGK